MSVFEKLTPKNYGVVAESLLTTASGLYGTIVGILVESLIHNSNTTGPILETPLQLTTTGTGMILCAFRRQIHGALNKFRANKNVKTTGTPLISIDISPRTNLWNKLALKEITREEFDKQMLLISNT